MAKIVKPQPAELGIRAHRPPAKPKRILVPSVSRKHKAIRIPISGQRVEGHKARLATKGHKRAELSEKCSGTEAFPVDSTPGRVSALVSGYRTVSDEQTRRRRRTRCSICLFRAAKMEIPD